ncbi:hypothetical protein Patl1_07643 [Pistacia atlantica]|uniref:Uncharacterized protein n=1 Tax=Pistacia atlantica TaxID=434234 RepID=A0ACC1AK98_9ROSI|nr:hypothetical protein Patl1_07643 [Pistacia atlantica]
MEVLIDGGSTHNFVQERVAVHLGLPIIAAPHFTVNLFVLLIRRADVVLGTHWLATLGHILMDYKALTISFDWRGARLSLQGRHRKELNRFNYTYLPSPPLAESTSAPTISRVLAHFGDVFVMPTACSARPRYCHWLEGTLPPLAQLTSATFSHSDSLLETLSIDSPLVGSTHGYSMCPQDERQCLLLWMERPNHPPGSPPWSKHPYTHSLRTSLPDSINPQLARRYTDTQS